MEITIETQSYSCTIGRGGLIDSSDKIEGDGCTPLGSYLLREVWFRPDRVEKPTSGLPVREITEQDCWCDESGYELYNKHFRRPGKSRGPGPQTETSHHNALDPGFRRDDEPTSFEKLWRKDHAYDLIVVIGYNDDPVVPEKGSAIFIHCIHDDGRPTAGCVALEKEDLLRVIAKLTPSSIIEITKNSVTII